MRYYRGMPAKNTTEVEPATDPVARALEQCSNAVGLKDLREGFTRSPTYDRLFALGWPCMRMLSDEPMPAAAVDKEVAAIEEVEHPAFRLVWPTRVARRIVRRWGTIYKAKLTKAIEKARAEDGPIDDDEARILGVRIALVGPEGAYDTSEDLVWLFEACVGPTRAATAMVTALEEAKPDWWAEASDNSLAWIYALGCVLLRVPEDVAKKLRGRLESIWRTHDKKHPDAFLTWAIDGVLHGSEGLERGLKRIRKRDNDPDEELNLRFCTLLRDEPAFVQRLIDEDARSKDTDPEGRYHAQLAFAGGDQGVASLTKTWRKLKGKGPQAFFVETVGQIRSPEVDRAIREMSTESKASKEAKALLDKTRS